MELRSLVDSRTSIRSVPISICPRESNQISYFHGLGIKFGSSRDSRDANNLKICHLRVQRASVIRRSISSSSVEPSLESPVGKGDGVVFVAGATGKVGSRTVRELLKLGFRVRAGVRNVQRADPLVQSVKQMKLDQETTGGEGQPVERLEIVQCDLERPDQIGQALGNASVVICAIGASEKEVFDVTGPYRIDYIATKNLVDAASVAKVDHFIMVSSLGTNKIGFPAAILNLFWGVLIWKRKAEEALIASGVPYTIVRPGGMERPTDSFKETHNMRLSGEDTLFGGLVSNLQIAELVAFMAKNQDLSYCKVVEVVAETAAPLRPMGELLHEIPSQRPQIKAAGVPREVKKPDASKIVSDTLTTTEAKEDSEKKALEMNPSTEPIPVVSESSLPDALSTFEIKPKEKESRAKRPLSPYSAYEDLKPPTSPSPSAPASPGKVDEPVNSTTKMKVEPPSLGRDSNDAAEAVEQANGSPQTSKYILSPYPAYSDFKPPTSPSPRAPVSKPPSVVSSDESESAELGEAEKKSATSDLPKPRPLSPYAVYEDLKPPSSPSPNAPIPKKIESALNPLTEVEAAPPSTGDNDDPVMAAESANGPPQTISYLSPYSVYSDLKPPTSPSPKAPVSKPLSSVVSSENSEPEKPDETSTSAAVPKPRPLSPYTMYDDMKPPATPMPSPKKQQH